MKAILRQRIKREKIVNVFINRQKILSEESFSFALIEEPLLINKSLS